MKVMLLNDTASVPHIGCQAVSDAHARMLGGMGHTVTRRHFLGELRHFALPDEAAAIEMVLRDESVRTDIESCDEPAKRGQTPFPHHNYAATMRNSVALATGRTMLRSRRRSTMP